MRGKACKEEKLSVTRGRLIIVRSNVDRRIKIHGTGTEEKYTRHGADRRALRQFAVPSIIAMLVGALYNIVDQFLSEEAWRAGECSDERGVSVDDPPVWRWRFCLESAVRRPLT